jgi:PIN domain nuclease of toxin-antitoxin system
MESEFYLYIANANIKHILDDAGYVIIAVIHTYEVSLKLWIGRAKLQFPCHHIVVDWQKQYNNWRFLDLSLSLKS